MTKREKRCEECAYMKMCKGKMTCEEKWGMACDEIEDCPEEIEVEEVEEIESKTAGYKVDHGAKAGTPKKERKPVPKKISDTKKQIFADILALLSENYGATTLIDGKKIELTVAGKHFTVDLVENRTKKA